MRYALDEELTVEVIGRYVGDAHFRLDVVAPLVAQRKPEKEEPQFDIDLPTLRHLAMVPPFAPGFSGR